MSATMTALRKRDDTTRVGEWAIHAGLLAVSILAALGLAGLLLETTGHDALEAYRSMWEGSLGSSSSIAATLNHAGPILLVAVGACVAMRAGLINLGTEGQVLVGALAATAVAVKLDLPTGLMLPAVLVAGALGGAAWAGIASLLRFGRGVSEVLTTLLMNFVAIQLISWMVNRTYLLQAGAETGAAASNRLPQSESIPAGAQLAPAVEGDGFAIQPVIVIALVIALVVAWLMRSTTWGLRLKMTSGNPRTAVRFGSSIAMIGGCALAVSGALAGLAGAAFLSSDAHRLTPGLSNSYGWDGFLVALIAGPRPLVAVPVALLYGGVRAGGGWMASIGVSGAIVGIVQALLVLAVLLPSLVVRHRARQRVLSDRAR
ncbi:ABC transporter permease [Aeromicrobium chenweiae]|uniref:ABC transporter permease n=1 Tax=Aeromicrobium chenweiae TaxID=2079793 RepID=A0A2S0WJ58_9ACTN|nr:ABC transporter permease [Aeromicrobium chenweiae]AWB91270.1 ABC transporter permease [Aeromicrobium chenweiae]TGN31788.1 ABC transporter permease [Aeromicrobium chenweiae]